MFLPVERRLRQPYLPPVTFKEKLRLALLEMVLLGIIGGTLFAFWLESPQDVTLTLIAIAAPVLAVPLWIAYRFVRYIATP